MGVFVDHVPLRLPRLLSGALFLLPPFPSTLQAKESYERRLRSLRQEHERVKAQFESRIATLQQAAGGMAGGNGSKSATAAAASSAPVKTFGQAQARVK